MGDGAGRVFEWPMAESVDEPVTTSLCRRACVDELASVGRKTIVTRERSVPPEPLLAPFDPDVVR